MVKAIDKWEVDVCRQNHLTRIDQVFNNITVTERQVTMIREGVTLFLMMLAFIGVWVATGV